MKNQNLSARKGYHSKEEILKISRAAFARNNIQRAFAGSENNGPTRHQKSSLQSTKLKSRKTKQSKAKVPIR